jgi:hypothetical protein
MKPTMNKKINILIASAFLLIGTAQTAKAQYSENPMTNRRWINFSNGVNTADNLSWQTALTYSKRSDVLMSSARLAYSQELIEGANDSVTFNKNKIIELGMMWGEAFGGNKWYISAAAGMGLNVRIYGDDIEDTTAFRTVTGLTIGVPVQIEAGFFINENWGVNATGVANWNFRQPYFGGHFGVIYRFKKSKSS